MTVQALYLDAGFCFDSCQSLKSVRLSLRKSKLRHLLLLLYDIIYDSVLPVTPGANQLNGWLNHVQVDQNGPETASP